MKLFRLFTGDDGEAQMEMTDLADRPEFSELHAAKAVVFRTYPAGHDFGRHTAPRRQYVTCVEGEAEVELDDGSVYRFIPGSWLLAEDMTGRGHQSRAVGERSARAGDDPPWGHIVIPISIGYTYALGRRP